MSCYLCSWYRAIESQGSAVCSSNFSFVFERQNLFFSPKTQVLGWKYVMVCIKNVYSLESSEKEETLRIRKCWYLICRRRKKKKDSCFKRMSFSILTGLYFCKKKKKKDKNRTKNKHVELDISTNSNVVLESEMEWQPAAFSATNRARRREYTCRTISSTPKGWSFLHSLSCNPHCSLQHYQMKENPTAFGKKWSFWMFDYKKNLYAFFFRRLLWGETTDSHICQSYFFRNSL